MQREEISRSASPGRDGGERVSACQRGGAAVLAPTGAVVDGREGASAN